VLARLAVGLALPALLAALAATPAAALSPDLGAAASLPAPLADPVEPMALASADADAGADTLALQAAGQEVALPLPVEVPLETALALPAVGLALEDGEAQAAAQGSPSPSASPSRHGSDLLPPVPPAAVAVAGTGLLAVLVGAAGMGLFSRIEGPAVLEHPTRARLMALVAERPGLTILHAQELLGAAWGTTVHHVRRLEANGLLATVRQGPRVLLYAANTPEAKARRDLALLRNGTAREVARLVAGAPGIRTGALSASLGIGAPSASKHLSRFAAAGLVERPQAGGFAATERLHQALTLV
jgi:DNA-binding transcriptional ArsR family regulator